MKLKIVSRMHAVNVFKGTDLSVSVIGRKFPGSQDGPFLCISILDFFHSSDIIPVFPIIDISELT